MARRSCQWPRSCWSNSTASLRLRALGQCHPCSFELQCMSLFDHLIEMGGMPNATNSSCVASLPAMQQYVDGADCEHFGDLAADILQAWVCLKSYSTLCLVIASPPPSAWHAAFVLLGFVHSLLIT
eukprot:3866283-Amphidinium_carterae.1